MSKMYSHAEGTLYPIIQLINEDVKQIWTQKLPLFTGLQLDFVHLETITL